MKLLSFISACMLMVNTTYANTTETVQCPSAGKIRQLAYLITEAKYSHPDKMYNAGSQVTFPDNNKEWKLASLYIQARNSKEAISIAQNRAVNVSQVLYQSGSRNGAAYLCMYYDGTLQNPYVSIIATTTVTGLN